MSEKFSLKKMPKPQRYGLYFLSFLALGVLVLWVWQFNYRLTSSLIPEIDNQDNDIADQRLFDDFQDFESSLGESDEIIGTISPSEDELLFNPDELPEETIDIPFQGPIIDDEFSLDSQDHENLLMDVMSGEADPESLRELLLVSGMDQAIINSFSDDELVEVYQEILGQ